MDGPFGILSNSEPVREFLYCLRNNETQQKSNRKKKLKNNSFLLFELIHCVERLQTLWTW